MGKRAGINDSGAPLLASLIQNRVRDNTVNIRLHDTLAHLVNCPAQVAGLSLTALPHLRDLTNEMPSGVSVVCKQLNTVIIRLCAIHLESMLYK